MRVNRSDDYLISVECSSDKQQVEKLTQSQTNPEDAVKIINKPGQSSMNPTPLYVFFFFS